MSAAVAQRRTWPLVVRVARAQDEAQVMAFATTTWDGWDYMPRAWPRWLEERDGVLLVGAVGGDGGVDADGAPLAPGSVVAVVRVAMPATGEAWLEGIRVDPRVRGMDVATDLQVAELRWAVANGARIVRYATSARNEASHRLGARGDFELITRFLHASWKPAEASDAQEHGSRSGFDPNVQAHARRQRRELLSALEDEGAVGHVTLGDSDHLWRLITSDSSFHAGARLYEPRPWAMEELTETKLRRHVSLGEVIVHRTIDGSEAVAILVAEVPPAENPDLDLALVVGVPRAAFELVECVRRSADAAIHFRYTPDAPLVRDVRQAYLDAGWELSDWELHIMARPIDDANPVPPVDPAALVLEDRPRAVITPPR